MAKRTALITGAAGGIGLETAKRLIQDGWRVGLLDIADTLPALLADLPGGPDDKVAARCDVADPVVIDVVRDVRRQEVLERRYPLTVSLQRSRWCVRPSAQSKASSTTPASSIT